MIEIVHSMKEIDRKIWETLVGKDRPETTYQWFSFAENISMQPKPYFCLAVYKDEKEEIKGILPAYYFYVRFGDLFKASGVTYLRRLFPQMKTPFKMTVVHLPLSCDFRYFGDPTHFNECLREIENFSRKDHHSSIMIKDSNEKMNLPDYLSIEIFPEVYIDPYPSWDSYIHDQKGKRGKHIRYEYKKSVDLGTKTYMVENLDEYTDLLYEMQVKVFEKNRIFIEFPRNYFKIVDEYLHEYSRCIFSENNGEITGYLYLLENDHSITCKYAGRNYEAEDSYVYFRLLYELIKYSIKTKKPVSMEKASYQAKIRRGFKIIEKFCYVKSNYPIVGDLYLSLVKRGNKEAAKRIEEVRSLQH